MRLKVEVNSPLSALCYVDRILRNFNPSPPLLTSLLNQLMLYCSHLVCHLPPPCLAYKHILWMPKMQEIWNWWENKNSYRQIFTTAYHVTENLRLIALSSWHLFILNWPTSKKFSDSRINNQQIVDQYKSADFVYLNVKLFWVGYLCDVIAMTLEKRPSSK